MNTKGNPPVSLVALNQADPNDHRPITFTVDTNGIKGLQVLLMGRQSDGTITPVQVDAQGRLITVVGT